MAIILCTCNPNMVVTFNKQLTISSVGHYNVKYLNDMSAEEGPGKQWLEIGGDVTLRPPHMQNVACVRREDCNTLEHTTYRHALRGKYSSPFWKEEMTKV